MQYKIDVESNMGLVHLIANSMRKLTWSGSVDYEDVVNDGVIGLIHAVNHFDPEKGYKFSSYAGMCIRGAMLQGNRVALKEHWNSKRNGINSTTTSMFGDDVSWIVAGIDDRGRGAYWVIENIWRSEVMEEVEKVLTPRQRQVLLMLFRKVRQTTISERLGISRALVSLDYRNIINKAKKRFAIKEAA